VAAAVVLNAGVPERSQDYCIDEACVMAVKEGSDPIIFMALLAVTSARLW